MNIMLRLNKLSIILIVILTFSGIMPVFAENSLIINEIDYDNVSTDNAEFIEIKNVSGSSIDLYGYTVEFINDKTDTAYRTITLPSTTLAANDYYVVCGNNTTVANCDLDVSHDIDLIQNGNPDAVAIKQGTSIVDTISYEGNTIPSVYTETTGTTVADSNTEPFVSLSRYPDGTDTNNNNADFALKCITPGLVNNIDDSSDCYALSIDDPSAVNEGNSGTTSITFTVTLSHTAASNVTVNYATTDSTATAGSDYIATSGTLTFTSGQTSKTVNVTVKDDQIDEGSSETFKVNLTSPSNNAQLSAIVGATEGIGTITDDDTAGFSLSKTTASVNESGTTDTFTVVLDSQPTSNVEISIISDNVVEVTVSPAILIFTPDNWNSAKTVTITGIDDGQIIDGNQNTTITLSVIDANSDDTYDTLADQTVTVTTVDNDTPGITVNPTTLSVSEPNSTGTFVIQLNTQPTGGNDVSVPFSVSGACSVNVTSPVTITNANWSTNATITVTASDDNIINGSSRTCTIITGNSSSSDTDYSNVNPSDVTVTVTDNDTAGISGAQIGGNINVSESGTTGSYTIALSSQPSGDVEITATADAQTQVSNDGTTFGNTAVFTFTNGNWNTAQTVTVKAIDDSVVEGNHTGTISQAITGTVNDGDYPTTLTLGSVTVNITDNDKALVTGGGSTSSSSTSLPSTMQVVVSLSGSGNGQVITDPTGIDCQKTTGICRATFSTGSKITLIATPDENSELNGFGGHTDCGDGSLYLTGNRQCTVFFKKKVISSSPIIPVYRLWSYSWQNHFYTTDLAERDRTLSHQQEWRDENIAYYIYAATDHPSNTQPVYRFWSYAWESHFYTMDQQEMERLVADFPEQWRYEGVAYYAYAEGEQPTNTMPIYRFYSFVFQSHFYTINEDEQKRLQNYPMTEWRYEGIAWYVPNEK